MPSTFKLALSVTVGSAILIGSLFYEEQPAAQQPKHQHQQTRQWAIESMVDLEKAGVGSAFQQRSAKYEACSREVRADYQDDPKHAYGWIRTLCH
jgi:hypothetical protein